MPFDRAAGDDVPSPRFRQWTGRPTSRAEFANVRGQTAEVGFDLFRRPDEASPQSLILSSYTYGTSIEMTLARHHAAQGEKSGGAETEFISTQHRSDDDVARKFEATVGAQTNTPTQTGAHERGVCVAKPELPRQAGILDGREGRGASPAVMSADRDHVSAGFGYTGRDDSDARARNQLHANARLRIDRAQVVNQLCQIFNTVDIVMRRRRNQRHIGHSMTEPRDVCRNLARRQLAAFAGLGALGNLDLQLVGVNQVLSGDTKARRGHLLDAVVGLGLRAGRFRGLPRPRRCYCGRQAGSWRWPTSGGFQERLRPATSPEC